MSFISKAVFGAKTRGFSGGMVRAAGFEPAFFKTHIPAYARTSLFMRDLSMVAIYDQRTFRIQRAKKLSRIVEKNPASRHQRDGCRAGPGFGLTPPCWPDFFTGRRCGGCRGGGGNFGFVPPWAGTV